MELEQIEGTVEDIIYENPDNGYTVFEISGGGSARPGGGAGRSGGFSAPRGGGGSFRAGGGSTRGGGAGRR